MNQFSIRTKNQNILRSKTKTFKVNYKESEARVRSSSSLNNLAGKLYSDNINREFSPNKTSKNSSTFSKHNSTSKLDNSHNPELSKSHAMGGLQLRASHVPCFSELNTDLLKQKKMLESLIANLKQAIAQQRRTFNKTDMQAKKNEACYNKNKDMYNQAHRRSLRLQQDINATNHDNYNLRNNIKKLRENIQQRQNNVNQESANCNRLENESKILKLSCMQEQKQKNNLKAELSKEQKVMNSHSIYNKELQNERAMLLIEINQSVSSFKL